MKLICVAYNKLGQYQEAADLPLRATRAKPDFPEAHYNLGTALYNRGDFKGAVNEFQQAVQPFEEVGPEARRRVLPTLHKEINR